MRILSTEKFFIADPYNEEHIKMLHKFEEKNEIRTKTSAYLENIKTHYNKEEYAEYVKNDNKIYQCLFLQLEGEIIDSCYIQGEKDTKSAKIFFAPITNSSKNRQIVSLATDYAFHVLGIEDIFVFVSLEDKALKNMLEKKDFESLGQEGKMIIYSKTKEDIKEERRRI